MCVLTLWQSRLCIGHEARMGEFFKTSLYSLMKWKTAFDGLPLLAVLTLCVNRSYIDGAGCCWSFVLKSVCCKLSTVWFPLGNAVGGGGRSRWPCGLRRRSYWYSFRGVLRNMCVCVCDLETSRVRRPRPEWGFCVVEKIHPGSKFDCPATFLRGQGQLCGRT